MYRCLALNAAFVVCVRCVWVCMGECKVGGKCLGVCNMCALFGVCMVCVGGVCVGKYVCLVCGYMCVGYVWYMICGVMCVWVVCVCGVWSVGGVCVMFGRVGVSAVLVWCFGVYVRCV